MEIRHIMHTARSATIEIADGGRYFTKQPVELRVNGEPSLTTEKTITSLFSLKPDQKYVVEAYVNGEKQGEVKKPDGSYRYEDSHLMGHGEASVSIIKDWIFLTDTEALAIRWHMGAYSGEQDWGTLSKVYDRSEAFPVVSPLYAPMCHLTTGFRVRSRKSSL